MSRPLAATFVATRICTRPERKRVQRPVALRLVQVALEDRDFEARRLQAAAEVAHAVLGAPENERRALHRLLEQADQRLELVFAVDLHHQVLDIRLAAVILV